MPEPGYPLRPRCAGFLLLAGLGMASAPCVSQQVYKWRDAAGTVHYSEQAPPVSMKSTSISLSSSTATETPAADPVVPTDEAALAAASDKQEQHLCTVARGNLALLDSDSIIANGGDIATATQLRGEQREKARAEAKSQIARYCHGH
jgi:hypothetical protein